MEDVHTNLDIFSSSVAIWMLSSLEVSVTNLKWKNWPQIFLDALDKILFNTVSYALQKICWGGLIFHTAWRPIFYTGEQVQLLNEESW